MKLKKTTIGGIAGTLLFAVGCGSSGGGTATGGSGGTGGTATGGTGGTATGGVGGATGGVGGATGGVGGATGGVGGATGGVGGGGGGGARVALVGARAAAPSAGARGAGRRDAGHPGSRRRRADSPAHRALAQAEPREAARTPEPSPIPGCSRDRMRSSTTQAAPRSGRTASVPSGPPATAASSTGPRWSRSTRRRGAIPWLLLRASSTTGTGVFTNVTYVQRLNTTGGVAPATGCGASTSGTDTSVAYTADYYFYTGGGSAAWLTPPANIPSAIAVPSGSTLAIHDHGVGTQIYTCTASGGAGGAGGGGADAGAIIYSWVLKGPDAILSDATFAQVGTHGVGPTWTSSDGSMISGTKVAQANNTRPATRSPGCC